MTGEAKKQIAIVGAGVFGLSLALALQKRGHSVTVFDRYCYDETLYQPESDQHIAASVDHNKIFRASYGTKLHYQRLALEARKAWEDIDEARQDASHKLFDPCGMLRVQPTNELSPLEKETLANMEREGLRDTQFVEGVAEDCQRAKNTGWGEKLLRFNIPDDPDEESFEAVLDSLAGFTRCSDACAHFFTSAKEAGVVFKFGDGGTFASLIQEGEGRKRRAVGLKTNDGSSHKADVVIVAAGSFSTQVLPDLAYHMESSAGSIATFKIDESKKALWDKYSPERFPVMNWKSTGRDEEGRDRGSVYVLPRTPEGLLKIGYRGVKFTNFQQAPENAPFTQNGKWSIPLPASECNSIPEKATTDIRHFVEVFLPEFKDVPFHSTKLCWYTDTLDNSFLIDYVPTYADQSVFVCTGGSGHGAKFMPVLGEHAADILENGDASTTPMRRHWRWRDDAPRGNGLQEGPHGPRNIGRS